VKLQDFHVEHADWGRAGDREALRSIRLEVFVREQAVPESLEWDDLDPPSFHLLARSGNGEPIGCARLTPEGRISRVAVRQPWRGQGVGLALLRALVARARSQGRTGLVLHAQLSAVAFYEREGFIAYGETFEDAGIGHRSMRLTLEPDTAPAASNVDDHALPTGSRSEIAASRLQLLAETKHRLSIYQPALDTDLYASLDEMAELRRIATSGRGANIRILLHDPEAALRNSHRLVSLAQRLPSVLHIRTPLEEVDLAYASAYLLTDQGGYLFQPDARRADARASLRDRAAQAPLAQHFSEVWERSAPARALQPLDL
jgi:predicted GNAT family N-acyltransferase